MVVPCFFFSKLEGQFDHKRQETNNLLNAAMKKKMEMIQQGAQERAHIEHNNLVYKTRKHEV